MSNCLECVTGKRLVELQLADNPNRIKPAQVTTQQAAANVAATCAEALLTLEYMQDHGTWPETVKTSDCPVLDVAIYDVEVVKDA